MKKTYLRLWLLALVFSSIIQANENLGFYRYPAIHGDTLVLTAEGDLWKVSVGGGQASRLTSNHGFESHSKISPDGKKVAFVANYEGPQEVYVMPLEGGKPKRLTFSNSSKIAVKGWTHENKILYASNHDSPHPQNVRLFLIDAESRHQEKIPLHQASDGAFHHKNLYFTRLTGSQDNIRNYRGGTAKSLWLYKPGQEATPLTKEFPGTSTSPLIWQNRVYFINDRTKTMNLWSMNFEGSNVKQHTFYDGEDIHNPDMHQGIVVYRLGADIYRLDLSHGQPEKIQISLNSDFDQTRARWIKTPFDYLTDSHLSPDSKNLLLTARGHIVVNPVKSGRSVTIPTPVNGMLFKQAEYIPHSGNILALASHEKELSFWILRPDGSDKGRKKLLTLEKSINSGPFVSPNGQYMVWYDSDSALQLTQITDGNTKVVDHSQPGAFSEHVSWAPDSQWFAFTKATDNRNHEIRIHSVVLKENFPVTSNRYNNVSPAWSDDGEWLYFISNRFFSSQAASPFGQNQPEAFSTKNHGIFAVAIDPQAEWPFKQDTELTGLEKTNTTKPEDNPSFTIYVETAQLQMRLYEVPVEPAQRSHLQLANDCIYWLEHEGQKMELKGFSISNREQRPFVAESDLNNYQVSFDEETLLIQSGSDFLLKPVGRKQFNQSTHIPLSNWRIKIEPTHEWRQILFDIWSIYKHFFVCKDMNGEDWDQALAQQLPLLNRVKERRELDELVNDMLGRLGVLHTHTYAGDVRRSGNRAFEGSLGAKLIKKNNTFVVEYIFSHDPDLPSLQSPLGRPDIDVQKGDLLTHINYQAFDQHQVPEELLTHQSGKQVLLQFLRPEPCETFKVMVEPLNPHQAELLYYSDWVEQKRLHVDKAGNNRIGYVHLPGMSTEDFQNWVRQYYPVHNREGLIVDIRYNSGGNISSWILNRLTRKAYSYSSVRGTLQNWNMPYAFRGHIVLLVNEYTMSDAEELVDGFRTLNIGTVIGTRTWGGRIYTFYVPLIDNAEVSLPFFAQVLPNASRPSENWGAEPDIQVDNLPSATYHGEDAQLKRAIEFLLDKADRNPIQTPAIPEGPLSEL